MMVKLLEVKGYNNYVRRAVRKWNSTGKCGCHSLERRSEFSMAHNFDFSHDAWWKAHCDP